MHLFVAIYCGLLFFAGGCKNDKGMSNVLSKEDSLSYDRPKVVKLISRSDIEHAQIISFSVIRINNPHKNPVTIKVFLGTQKDHLLAFATSLFPPNEPADFTFEISSILSKLKKQLGKNIPKKLEISFELQNEHKIVDPDLKLIIGRIRY
jgi:hypothetical protein